MSFSDKLSFLYSSIKDSISSGVNRIAGSPLNVDGDFIETCTSEEEEFATTDAKDFFHILGISGGLGSTFGILDDEAMQTLVRVYVERERKRERKREIKPN